MKNHSPCLFVLFLILSLRPNASAQVIIQGTVQSAYMEKPVPFVNIGIPEAGIGTVSDENGKFNLKVPDTSGVVRFSAIGYATRDMKISILARQKIVLLKASVIELPTIDLSARQFGQEIILGKTVR